MAPSLVRMNALSPFIVRYWCEDEVWCAAVEPISGVRMCARPKLSFTYWATMRRGGGKGGDDACASSN